MGKFDEKNKEKPPSDANKKGRGFGSGNFVHRETVSGMSKALNAIQVKFDCGEGNEGGQFLECPQVTTMYLRTKLEGGGGVETSIRNGRVLNPAWPEPVGPTQEATKSMLQADYNTRAKRAEKLRINLRTDNGLVLGQCTNYLQVRL